MGGNHNLYCSGNQPDIVERLRGGIKHPQQNVALREEAADEIERLRKDAEMYKKIMRELHSVGRYLPSEDELIRQGVCFTDYERGVNDVITAIDAAMEANRG